jgi:cation/acetate symporter
VTVPCVVALLVPNLGVARAVGLAFAMAAATFCPLLLLGIWWRGLTAAGAIAGLAVGGTLSVSAVLTVMLGGTPAGWLGAVVAQPALVSVPAAFASMIGVSLLTRAHLPAHLARTLVRLHTPEDLDLDRGSYHPENARS